MFKLGILAPSLETRVSGDRSHPYRKDRWRLHFYVCGHPSQAKNRYDITHSGTRDTPFNLTFRPDAIILAEIRINSLQVAHFDPEQNESNL